MAAESKPKIPFWLIGLGLILVIIIVPIFVFLPKAEAKEDAWANVPVTIGKKNQINNFCNGIQGNWKTCTTCHAGYGWLDAGFDFTAQENVDCLVCHDQTATYAKTTGGYPAEGIDLLTIARSVGTPTRENCGGCHFNGGGNGVKHGDLGESLTFPSESVDVHMGGHDFQCVDCHPTEDHNINGRPISVSFDMENQIYGTDCHNETLHEDGRIDAHVASVACQACHIPNGALRDPTKMFWDWSTAGQNLPEDHFTFLRIKGSFVYESDYVPQYTWYSGIADPNSRIMPFKLHVAMMPYDTVNNYLLQPRTGGEGGLWTTFDGPSALALDAQDTGLQFSGQYDFTETWMYWPTTHMVQTAENALTCEACHGAEGRLDWLVLAGACWGLLLVAAAVLVVTQAVLARPARADLTAPPHLHAPGCCWPEYARNRRSHLHHANLRAVLWPGPRGR